MERRKRFTSWPEEGQVPHRILLLDIHVDIGPESRNGGVPLESQPEPKDGELEQKQQEGKVEAAVVEATNNQAQAPHTMIEAPASPAEKAESESESESKALFQIALGKRGEHSKRSIHSRSLSEAGHASMLDEGAVDVQLQGSPDAHPSRVFVRRQLTRGKSTHDHIFRRSETAYGYSLILQLEHV